MTARPLTNLQRELLTSLLTMDEAAGRPTGDIYFIRAGDFFIKIGYTANPVSRVISMRTECPLPLSILHFEPGTFKTEKVIHRQFAHIRLRGEWFHVTRELLDFIAQRKAILGGSVSYLE